MTTARRSAPRSTPGPAGGEQVRALHRALDILEVLAESRASVPLADLADRLGLPRSTAHRLLATLASRGYVAQDPETGRYRIGVRAFEVGSAFTSQTRLRDVARPFMRHLQEESGETVNLAVLDGGEAVYVDQVESTRMVRTFADTGARVPVHCTGVGKALLAGLGDSEIRRIIRSHGLPAFTPQTITNLKTLMEDLRQGRKLGYFVDNEEREPGVRCAAAPVYDHTGRVIAALSISAPAYRTGDASLAEMGQKVRRAALAVSQALGYRPEARRRPDGYRLDGAEPD